MSISGIVSMSDDSDSDGDENEENEQRYESTSESPSSDFSSTELTAGQRASSTPAADNADIASGESNSGSFSPTPDFPFQSLSMILPMRKLKREKKEIVLKHIKKTNAWMLNLHHRLSFSPKTSRPVEKYPPGTLVASSLNLSDLRNLNTF